MFERDTVKILGFPVDRLTMDRALSAFEEFLDNDSLSVIVTPNAEILENATKNEALATVIKNADLVIPDGSGVLWASKITGKKLPERVTGIDFSFNALKLIAKKSGNVFLLGSKPGVAEKAAENLKKDIKTLHIVGTHDGYFKPEEELSLVQEINASEADFLCVALGSPKQELFIDKYKNLLNAKVAIGIGGSLDVWAGNVERAPEFYQKHGLEWLYRVIKQPARIKRIGSIPKFMFKVAFTKKEK